MQDDSLAKQSENLSVDVMITTYNEAVPLVEESVISAKKLTYKYAVNINIYILDDGKRARMERMCSRQNVSYITRNNNKGYKAGNICNALKQTSGDFIIICDADTRLSPQYLNKTLGYFKNPKMSWVQTPQWFYDIPKGQNIVDRWTNKYGNFGKYSAKIIEKCFGKIQLSRDPFCNEGGIFYDVILRRRNRANASFCCGAASIHRRNSVMENALRRFINDLKTNQDAEMQPYKYHVSEDIYTSLEQHQSKQKWQSAYHPEILSKMLSPQDIKTFLMQRYKYAAGSMDINIHDNPLAKKGLNFSQKLMYAATFWSYLGCAWLCIFLISPILYFFTSITPVIGYTADFFKHLIPFLILTEVSFMFATWGQSTFKSKASYISLFTLNLKALYDVIRRKEIKFKVTPKFRIGKGSVLPYIWIHLLLIGLTIIGAVFAFCSYFIYGNLDYAPNGLIVNSFWAIYNLYVLLQFVLASLWTPQKWGHPVTDIDLSLIHI